MTDSLRRRRRWRCCSRRWARRSGSAPARRTSTTAPAGRSRRRSASAETYDDNVSLFSEGHAGERTTYIATVFPGADLHYSASTR